MTQKLHYKIVCLFLVLLLMPNVFYVSPVSAQTTFVQSVNVAVISSLGVINGGTFPTTTTGPNGSFTDFNFYMLPVGSVSSAALGPGGICGSAGCDTALLNVASSGMACNVNRLSSQQKTDLVNFVEDGYKLIIYDSECVPQDYSWLPYTFTTANPGAQGAQGTLTIVEENTLSSNDPSSPYYINASMLGAQTDAVGDMNVMTTFDPNWFLDMSGTNILGVTGPVHTYAKIPPGADYGLIIYNGLDIDYMNSGTVPDSSTPAGNLAKIWLQELQQPFNPSRLPGGIPVIGIVLTPASAQVSVGGFHTVTATITDLLGNPQPSIQITFSVDSGPNTGASGICASIDCRSNASGQVSFTYMGIGGVGTDRIKGCFTNQQGQMVCSQFVETEWIQIGPCTGGAGFIFDMVQISAQVKSFTPKETSQAKYETTLKGEICPDASIKAGGTEENPEITIRTSDGNETTIIGRDGLITDLGPSTEVSPYYEFKKKLGLHFTPPFITVDITFKREIKGSEFTLTQEQTSSIGATPNPLPNNPDYIYAVWVVVSVLSVFLVAYLGTAAVAAALLRPALSFLLAFVVVTGSPTQNTVPTASVQSPLAIATSLNQQELSQQVMIDLETVFTPQAMSFATVSNLTLDSGLKGPDQDISFDGSGFTPNGTVDLHLIIPGSQSFASESQILANSDGTISGKIRLPANAGPGRWLLVAIDRQATINALQDFADARNDTFRIYLAANEVNVREGVPYYLPILDDFNRANGLIGPNWLGNKSRYRIYNNQLLLTYFGTATDIFWKTPFGADQEAYVTFAKISTATKEQSLLLKAQSNRTWGNGVLEVQYNPLLNTVQVWTYEWPKGWVKYGDDIAVTFVDGDVFGARARADGIVEIYRNGELLGTRDVTTWPYYFKGGYIGLWFLGTRNTVVDDFGGGTVPAFP